MVMANVKTQGVQPVSSMAYTDARPPRAQPRMQRVTATGAGTSLYAPAYDELPDDAFPVYLWKRASWQMHPCQKCSSFLSKPPANQKRQTLTISLSEVFISSVFPYVSSGVFCVT